MRLLLVDPTGKFYSIKRLQRFDLAFRYFSINNMNLNCSYAVMFRVLYDLVILE